MAFVGLHLHRAAISPNQQPGQVTSSAASFPVCIQRYSAGLGLQALPYAWGTPILGCWVVALSPPLLGTSSAL